MKIKNEKYIMPKTCIFANNIVGYIFVTNIVTDFTTSVYGSSCNYVSLFRPNLTLLLTLSTVLIGILGAGLEAKK